MAGPSYPFAESRFLLDRDNLLLGQDGLLLGQDILLLLDTHVGGGTLFLGTPEVALRLFDG